MNKTTLILLSIAVTLTETSAFNQSPERFEGECFIGMKTRCMLAGSGYFDRYKKGENKQESLNDAIANYKKACELGEKKGCKKVKELSSIQ